MNSTRKSTPAIILFAGDSHWRIAALSVGGPVLEDPVFTQVPIAVGTRPADIATAVMSALQRLAYQGQPAFLAIPASWCLAATIKTADLPKGDRKAMLFRLEEKLPIAAEDLIADFVPDPARASTGDTALGVCINANLLKPLIESLEAAGVSIESVSPIALAAAQSLYDDAQTEPVVLLTQDTQADDDQISALTIQSGSLTGWALLAKDLTDLRLCLDMIFAESEADWWCEAMSIPPAFASSIAASIDTPLAQRNENVSSAAALFGQAVLAGHRRPWIEFRRGPLAIQDRLRQHRQALNRLLVAAIVLLSVSTAVTLIRAGRYSRLEASLNDQMTQAFRGAFPGWPIPANLKAVVESEHRKAQTATGESLPAEGQGSAIQTLHDVLTRLPADGRSTLQSMSFEPDAFQIEGRLQSYDQINALVSAARDAGLDVPTPLTRRGSDGFWEFTLKGTRPAAGSNSASVAFKGNGG